MSKPPIPGFTFGDAQAIRAAYGRGVSVRELARALSVRERVIEDIVERRTHVMPYGSIVASVVNRLAAASKRRECSPGERDWWAERGQEWPGERLLRERFNPGSTAS